MQFVVDKKGRTQHPIEGLRKSVFEVEPSGRQMRRRETDRDA